MSRDLLVFTRKCNQAIRVKKYLKLVVHEIDTYNATLEFFVNSNNPIVKFCETYPRRVIESNVNNSWSSVKFTICNGDFVFCDDVLFKIVAIRHNDIEPKIQIGVESSQDLLLHREEVYQKLYPENIENEIF